MSSIEIIALVENRNDDRRVRDLAEQAERPIQLTLKVWVEMPIAPCMLLRPVPWILMLR